MLPYLVRYYLWGYLMTLFRPFWRLLKNSSRILQVGPQDGHFSTSVLYHSAFRWTRPTTSRGLVKHNLSGCTQHYMCCCWDVIDRQMSLRLRIFPVSLSPNGKSDLTIAQTTKTTSNGSRTLHIARSSEVDCAFQGEDKVFFWLWTF